MNFQDNGQLGDCACGPCCVHPRGPVLAMCCLRDPRARVAMWPCFGSPSGPEGCDTGLIFSHPPPLSRSGRKAPSPRDPGLPGGVCSRCLLHGSLGPREGGSGQDIVKSQIKKKKKHRGAHPQLDGAEGLRPTFIYTRGSSPRLHILVIVLLSQNQHLDLLGPDMGSQDGVWAWVF